MDRLGVRQVPEGSAEQGEVEETGCEIIYGAQTTLAVKGKMMMMIVFSVFFYSQVNVILGLSFEACYSIGQTDVTRRLTVMSNERLTKDVAQ